MMLSTHLSLDEGIKSQVAIRKGIDNTPNEEQQLNMKHWAVNIYEPVRRRFGATGIASFFRCAKLNKCIGGSKTSDHCNGSAGDLDGDIYQNTTNLELFNWIRENLDFDQLIFEGKKKDGNPEWVHVSLRRLGVNRKQVLFADFSGKKVVYTKI